MSTITDAFDVAARALLKDAWVKRAHRRPLFYHGGPIGRCVLSDPEYPAELVRFVEAQIDGVPITFMVRMRPIQHER